ncbi:MAG: UDP-3-O-acyl-N-acetylglucosamine deacetylase [Rhizobiaceae bacterium]|nr:UDP-3-O-acyl-N-acetylglucosamine deacetylase [Rhizobiaceae bacterium]
MGIDLREHQTTLKSDVLLCGIGVHSGQPASLTLHPAEAGTGIVFHCQRDGMERTIRAVSAEVGSTDLCTVLGDPSGVSVATVEHVMAALFGLGLDNVVVDVDGPEAPILDGSSAPIVEAIDQAGIAVLPVKRRFIRVTKAVRVEAGGSWAEFRPHPVTRFEIEIDFASPAIGRQKFERDLDADVFRAEIARARTFGFMKDVERLWAAGYALGSSLENSVVIGDDDRVINMEGLRYPDEFVRHKTLDALGDLALAGTRFLGCFRSYKGGHKLNAAALGRLLSDSSAFEIVESVGRGRDKSGDMVVVSAPVQAP